MFQIGDKIVHPMHGAGIIDGVVSRQTHGVTRDYYTLKLSVGGMTLMIPTENSAEIGVRPVVEPETIDSVNGASVTSGAVVDAVNAALDFYAANLR